MQEGSCFFNRHNLFHSERKYSISCRNNLDNCIVGLVVKSQFTGFFVVDLIEVRFAFSGTVSSMRKKSGDPVKKGEVIASLSRKFLQTELDRQLADYEKTRAAFELFKIKYPADNDDSIKYQRQQVQASLNSSVKEVELSKFKMDQADLSCPVNGAIVDLGGLVSGLNVTPASNPVTVVNRDALRFVFTIGQDDLPHFRVPINVIIRVPAVKEEMNGETVVPTMGRNSQFDVYVPLPASPELLSGMKGTAHVD